MQDADALIEIVDEKGKSLGHKQRKDVDKRRDILKAVYILVENDSGRVLLTRSSSDPLYPNKWGCSAAGLIRHEETAKQAAERTLRRELNISANLEEMGSGFYNFSGVKRWMWMYRVKAKVMRQNLRDSDELSWFSVGDARLLIKEGGVMPMLEPQIIALESRK